MCNTFGGVMFIAIALVVISSHIPKLVEELDEETLTEQQVEQLSKRLDERKSQFDELIEKKMLKSRIVEKYKNSRNIDMIEQFAAQNDEISRIKAEKEKMNSELGRMEAELKIQQEFLDGLQAEMQKYSGASEKNKELDEQKKKLIEEIASLEDKLRSTRENQTIVMPKFKRTAKMPFLLMLKGGRLFRISDHTNVSVQNDRGLNLSDDVTHEYVEAENKLYFQPRENKGFKITPDDSDLEQAWRALLSHVNLKERFLWIIVMDDSFPEFLSLKCLARKKGASVYWYPVIRDSEFFIYFTEKTNYESD
jgi:myosin heavy subunit